MKIDIKTFTAVLDLLDYKDVIEGYYFPKGKKNIVQIDIPTYSYEDTCFVEFEFDDNGIMLSPKIKEIKHQLEILEEQKKELERQLKLLTL